MKTVKEAARAHFDTITLPGINTGGDVFVNVKKEAYKDVFIESFEAGVEYAQRWISVEDELPTDTYLGKDEQGKVELFQVCEPSFIKDVGITHWRHIELK